MVRVHIKQTSNADKKLLKKTEHVVQLSMHCVEQSNETSWGQNMNKIWLTTSSVTLATLAEAVPKWLPYPWPLLKTKKYAKYSQRYDC